MAKKSKQLINDEQTIDVGDEDMKGQDIVLEETSSEETQTETVAEVISEETSPESSESMEIA